MTTRNALSWTAYTVYCMYSSHTRSQPHQVDSLEHTGHKFPDMYMWERDFTGVTVHGPLTGVFGTYMAIWICFISVSSTTYCTWCTYCIMLHSLKSDKAHKQKHKPTICDTLYIIYMYVKTVTSCPGDTWCISCSHGSWQCAAQQIDERVFAERASEFNYPKAYVSMGSWNGIADPRVRDYGTQRCQRCTILTPPVNNLTYRRSESNYKNMSAESQSSIAGPLHNLGHVDCTELLTWACLGFGIYKLF